jgi:branched-chain amino acid transport system ATP-binding protein
VHEQHDDNRSAVEQEQALLETHGLSVAYGGLHALEDITLQVRAGEFVTVIGPNGAGKTTLLKSVSGTVPLSAGRIVYRGTDLATIPGHARATLGIAHVPEGRKVFPTLSVLENLALGAYRPAARTRRQASLQMVFDLFPVLYERRQQAAGTLSGGEQQMLALGRGLMLCPELLLLDEPSLGLAPLLVESIFDSIVRMRAAQRLTILLVEQRVVEALELCDRGYVLDAGRLVLAGRRDVLLNDARVRRAYLGA